MPDGNLILNSAVTLAAVGLGAWLTLLTQTRASARAGSQRWRETRIACYSRFLGAMRTYVTYIRQPTARIEAVPHPDRGHLVPLFDHDGMRYVEAAEAALAEVRLLARNEDTASHALALLRAIHHVAAARTSYGPGLLPDDSLVDFRTAQHEFILAARRELKAG
jgi:hypothetical protein